MATALRHRRTPTFGARIRVDKADRVAGCPLGLQALQY